MKEIKIGTATLIHGDCEEFMKDLPDKCFDLAVVDPPYGININISIGRRSGDLKSKYHKFSGLDKSIPDENYFNHLDIISKNQIIWGGNYMTDFLYPSSCWLMWDKGFSQDVSFAQYEMAWTSFKTSAKKFEFNAAANKKRIHPTQKPVKLYEWIYANYAKPGQTILDTHGGSMSSVIAALNMGYEITCIEKDEDYFNAAVERVIKSQQQQRMFP